MPGAQSVLSEREQFSSRDGSWDGPGSSVGVLGSDHWALGSLRWRLVPAALAEIERDSWSLLSLTGSGLTAATGEGCRVLFSILLTSSGDSAPGCGPPGPSLELPAHRALAIVCWALVWSGLGPALGLWERIRGAALLPLSVNLIKGIPGMTEPCVLRGCPPTQQSPLLDGWSVGGVWGAWHCSRPQGPHSVVPAVAACSRAPASPLRGPSKELSVLIS